MIVYSISGYIESCESLDAKITALQALIDSMLLKATEAIDDAGVASYMFDDGQVKITTNYRNFNEITLGIKNLERILQMYINKRNGHITVLRGRLNY